MRRELIATIKRLKRMQTYRNCGKMNAFFLFVNYSILTFSLSFSFVETRNSQFRIVSFLKSLCQYESVSLHSGMLSIFCIEKVLWLSFIWHIYLSFEIFLYVFFCTVCLAFFSCLYILLFVYLFSFLLFSFSFIFCYLFIMVILYLWISKWRATYHFLQYFSDS